MNKLNESGAGCLLAELSDATDQLLAARKSAASRRPVGRALLATAPALLAAGGAPALAADDGTAPSPWKIETAVLFYSEVDRVSAIEPVISATREFAGEKTLNTKLVIDVLTGASPNGAVPSQQAQTYTRPSGNGSYTIDPNQTPLDDTFHDTRVALSGNWSQPLTERLDGNIGVNVSKEYDYLSLGLNGGLSMDFNQNNTTASFGIGYAHDQIDPEGGIPLVGACMFGASASSGCTETSFAQTRDGNSDSKDTVDLLLGVTQVLDRKTVAQFNYSVSMINGYQNDPFKVVSVVDTDNSVGNGIGEPERHLYESRPDSRVKHGLFARVLRSLREHDVLDASYRYQTDDWGMRSHTLDLRYRWAFRDNQALTPHFRWYKQSEVDFYRPYLLDSEALPTNFTSDYRQGSFDGLTLGLEYAYRFENDRELKVALEYYRQSGDQPANAPGQLANQDLFPDLDAVMLRFNYDFDW